MRIAQINVFQKTQFGSDTRYSWGVRDLEANPDESAGMPTGSGKRTVAAALLEAVNVAIVHKYEGARVSYYPASGVSKEFDCTFASGEIDMTSARVMADKLMES